MEVLKPEDLLKEREGFLCHGMRWFPRSKPIRMLRIFRTRFNCLKGAETEVERVKIAARYLGGGRMAMSQEFLVDYRESDISDFLLCGLQEYIDGEVVDPWGLLDERCLVMGLQRMLCDLFEDYDEIIDENMWVKKVKRVCHSFCVAVRCMIMEAGFIPDLAGVGNLRITVDGDIKLVDINNISMVNFDSGIYLDDKGYPVCDKSIQALSMLEKKILGKEIDGKDPISGRFLDPSRIKDVAAIEKEFHVMTAYGSTYPVGGSDFN
jgi:hypothetical protein